MSTMWELFNAALALVRRGAELIDNDPNIVGDWRADVQEAIEREKLDMRLCADCVIGIVYGISHDARAGEGTRQYDNALHQLGIDDNDAGRYGFDSVFTEAGYVSYEVLADAWAEYLAREAEAA